MCVCVCVCVWTHQMHHSVWVELQPTCEMFSCHDVVWPCPHTPSAASVHTLTGSLWGGEWSIVPSLLPHCALSVAGAGERRWAHHSQGPLHTASGALRMVPYISFLGQPTPSPSSLSLSLSLPSSSCPPFYLPPILYTSLPISPQNVYENRPHPLTSSLPSL